MKPIHELKTWTEPFQAIWEGRKRYEIRKNDRSFSIGDFLNLREFDPETETYTGRSILAGITYMSRGGTWGLPSDLDVLGLSVAIDRSSEEPSQC